jgi:hypothetical protein
VDASVPDGWHTPAAALVDFAGIFLLPSFSGTLTKLLVAYYPAVFDALLGLAIAIVMSHHLHAPI